MYSVGPVSVILKNRASEFPRNTATKHPAPWIHKSRDCQWPWRLNFVRGHPVFVRRYWPPANVVWHEAHSTVWNLPYFTLLAPRILRWLLDFWRFVNPILHSGRLCGLVVRVSGYRYRGPGFDPRRYQIFWVVVGLEWGPLSLMRSIEELLEWKK